MKLVLRDRILDLAEPVVMGVLNVTPDSFSDGGRYFSVEEAVAQGERIAADGAAIVDIGGESTRPGAAPVGAEEEIRRVVPVIKRLAGRIQASISVDTSKPEVIRAAVAAGASMVNDVRALRIPGALAAAVDSGAAVCLMHMRGEPATMQDQPVYLDALAEIQAFLQSRVTACEVAGIRREQICIDPGIGFGKTPDHNLAILARLSEVGVADLPVLVGVSRKSLVGIITGRAPDDRYAGSVAFAALAAARGASIVRAHDVAATLDAIKVGSALRRAGAGGV
jgi:dihydropteroate synthase